ncbi:hypothetical protein BC567DRAFT_230255 [Phyllosticta citribraziliensis]
MRALIHLFCALLFAFVSATSGPPKPPCNKYGKCQFPSVRLPFSYRYQSSSTSIANTTRLAVQGSTKISDLGEQPYKGKAADETFKNCILLCKRYTTDGSRHPGFQTVAWIEDDGCYCGVDSIGFVLGKEGPKCRASDITCEKGE